jgi:hypothetical protein
MDSNHRSLNTRAGRRGPPSSLTRPRCSIRAPLFAEPCGDRPAGTLPTAEMRDVLGVVYISKRAAVALDQGNASGSGRPSSFLYGKRIQDRRHRQSIQPRGACRDSRNWQEQYRPNRQVLDRPPLLLSRHHLERSSHQQIAPVADFSGIRTSPAWPGAIIGRSGRFD